MVPYTQSEAYYKMLLKHMKQCRLELMEGMDHADAKLFTEVNVMRMFDFTDMVLGR